MTLFDWNDSPWTLERVKTARFDEVLASIPVAEHTTVRLTFHLEEHGVRWVGVAIGDAEEIALHDAQAVGAVMKEIAHRGTAVVSGARARGAG